MSKNIVQKLYCTLIFYFLRHMSFLIIKNKKRKQINFFKLKLLD